MSWWPYHGRCTGRILHFLYHYCGFDVAEHATVGDGKVIYWGKDIATFAWSDRFGEADVPVFTFAGDLAQAWTATQHDKREAAIVDALPVVPAARLGAYIAPEQIHAFNPEIEQRATLWAGVVAKVQPQFFTCAKTLYCLAGGHYFYWHREIGEWLRAAAPEGT